MKETEFVYSAVRSRPFKWIRLRSVRRGLNQFLFLSGCVQFSVNYHAVGI